MWQILDFFLFWNVIAGLKKTERGSVFPQGYRLLRPLFDIKQGKIYDTTKL
jgi:hypothetical protein